jgi:hypothetical protein
MPIESKIPEPNSYSMDNIIELYLGSDTTTDFINTVDVITKQQTKMQLDLVASNNIETIKSVDTYNPELSSVDNLETIKSVDTYNPELSSAETIQQISPSSRSTFEPSTQNSQNQGNEQTQELPGMSVSPQTGVQEAARNPDTGSSGIDYSKSKIMGPRFSAMNPLSRSSVAITRGPSNRSEMF